MSESEILQGLFSAITGVLAVVSLFVGIVSGYLAGLYFFLGRAPFLLRLVAFLLLSFVLMFLGGVVLVVQIMQDGLLQAWAKVPAPAIGALDLRNPLPIRWVLKLSQQETGVALGWCVGIAVYLALAYMTFLHRWPEPRDP